MRNPALLLLICVDSSLMVAFPKKTGTKKIKLGGKWGCTGGDKSKPCALGSGPAPPTAIGSPEDCSGTVPTASLCATAKMVDSSHLNFALPHLSNVFLRFGIPKNEDLEKLRPFSCEVPISRT
jgi:hypothetical protein